MNDENDVLVFLSQTSHSLSLSLSHTHTETHTDTHTDTDTQTQTHRHTDTHTHSLSLSHTLTHKLYNFSILLLWLYDHNYILNVFPIDCAHIQRARCEQHPKKKISLTGFRKMFTSLLLFTLCYLSKCRQKFYRIVLKKWELYHRVFLKKLATNHHVQLRKICWWVSRFLKNKLIHSFFFCVCLRERDREIKRMCVWVS